MHRHLDAGGAGRGMSGVTSPVSYADVVPGTELPVVTYPVTRLSLVKYCGAR